MVTARRRPSGPTPRAPHLARRVRQRLDATRRCDGRPLGRTGGSWCSRPRFRASGIRSADAQDDRALGEGKARGRRCRLPGADAVGSGTGQAAPGERSRWSQHRIREAHANPGVVPARARQLGGVLRRAVRHQPRVGGPAARHCPSSGGRARPRNASACPGRRLRPYRCRHRADHPLSPRAQPLPPPPRPLTRVWRPTRQSGRCLHVRTGRALPSTDLSSEACFTNNPETEALRRRRVHDRRRLRAPQTPRSGRRSGGRDVGGRAAMPRASLGHHGGSLADGAARADLQRSALCPPNRRDAMQSG